MSTRDFEYKQIAFVFTDEGEKISFKNDNLVVTDADGKVLFIIKNENLMADEKSCNSMLYIEESRLV